MNLRRRLAIRFPAILACAAVLAALAKKNGVVLVGTEFTQLNNRTPAR